MQWSYSKRELLEKCPRWYYYQYYGANAKTAKAEPQKETLRFLRTLTNRNIRSGKILHLVIRTYLKKLQQGEKWSLDRLLNWAQEIYNRDREYSLNRIYEHSHTDEKYPPVALLEFHYQFNDVEQLYAESEERLFKALRNFLTSETIRSLIYGASQAEAFLEKRIHIKNEHFTAMGQIDLLYPKDDNRIVIADWKLGEANGTAESLQLLVYAIWALEKYKLSPGDLILVKAYLADGRTSITSISQRSLHRASARIMQDIEKMKTLDEYGKNAVAEAFTPCGKPNICKLCPFQQICPKEP